MSGPSTEAQVWLWRLAGEAKNLFASLTDLLELLPPSPREQAAEDDLDEEPDAPLDVRSAVLCILGDLLRPAVRELLLAAGASPEEAARETPAVPAVPREETEGQERARREREPAPAETSPAGERAVVTVGESAVPVPAEMALFLGLAPFDLLALDVRPNGVVFEPVRALLSRLWLLPPEGQLAAVQAISQGQLTLMLASGLVLVPGAVESIRVGEQVVLEVEPGEYGRRLRISPAGPPPAAGSARRSGEEAVPRRARGPAPARAVGRRGKEPRG
jgi:hypothetical protein